MRFLFFLLALKIRCAYSMICLCVSSYLSVGLSTSFAVFTSASRTLFLFFALKGFASMCVIIFVSRPFHKLFSFHMSMSKQQDTMISLFGSNNFFAAPFFFKVVDKGERRCGNVTDPLFRWRNTISTLDHHLYLISSLTSHYNLITLTAAVDFCYIQLSL